jgi:hypothetical protein
MGRTIRARPRRGPPVVIGATLILFDVVPPGEVTDVLVAPEILWEAAPPGATGS